MVVRADHEVAHLRSNKPKEALLELKKAPTQTRAPHARSGQRSLKLSEAIQLPLDLSRIRFGSLPATPSPSEASDPWALEETCPAEAICKMCLEHLHRFLTRAYPVYLRREQNPLVA